METMKMLTNSSLKGRIRQIMVLLIIIVIGMVISRVVNGQVH